MRDSCITVGVRHTHTRRDGGKTVRMDFGASSVVPSVQTDHAIHKMINYEQTKRFDTNMEQIIFAILCQLLAMLGAAFNLSYVEISVILCLIIVPIVCILSAVMIMIGTFRNFTQKNTRYRIMRIILSIIYIGVYVYLFKQCCTHYFPTGTIDYNYAFELCKNDLIHIAEIYNTSYAMVNLIIYVIAFGAILVLNGILGFIANKKKLF